MIHLLDYFNWIDLDDQFVHNSVKLLENDSERFESRFSEIKVNNTDSIFYKILEIQVLVCGRLTKRENLV